MTTTATINPLPAPRLWRQSARRLLLAGIWCLLPLAHADTPAEILTKLPPIQSVALSPDGKQAVVLRAIGETYHATLMDFETQKSRLLMSADPDEFLFNWCRFANPKRVVCSIRSYILMHSKAGAVYRDGRTVATRLLAVDTDGTNVLQLIRPKRTRTSGDIHWVSPRQDDVVSWLPDDKDHILIALARDDRIHPSVYKLNINNNKMKRVRRHHSNVFSWRATHDGKIKHGLGVDPAGEAYAYAVSKRSIKRLDLTGMTGRSPPSLMGYTEDGSGAYVIANNGQDTRGLYVVDSETGAVTKQIVHHPEFDVAGISGNGHTGRIFAARIPGLERHHFMDEALGATVTAIKAALPGTPSDLGMLALSADDNRLVIQARGNRTAPALYLYDRAAKKLSLIAESYPGLDSQHVAEHRPVHYAARDGLRIPAFLTLPPQIAGKPDAPLPAVILPHGGPTARDNGLFDYWAQLLANEGYVVLQPNFRGSTGYGDRFTEAGAREWGLSMQDDLDDGLAWLVAQRYADPERVCIVGGSYGGYAALVASFKSSDRYRCAVSFAGVSDLDDQVGRWRSRINSSIAIARIQRGRARAENSPLQQVAKINVPLLLAHGDVDRSVMIEQSRRLVDKLTAAKKEFRYIEQTNGDHFLSLQSHRTEFLNAMREFLAQHLQAADG